MGDAALMVAHHWLWAMVGDGGRRWLSKNREKITDEGIKRSKMVALFDRWGEFHELGMEKPRAMGSNGVGGEVDGLANARELMGLLDRRMGKATRWHRQHGCYKVKGSNLCLSMELGWR